MSRSRGAAMNSTVVASTVMFAVSKGVPLDRLIAETGLDPQRLTDPDARIPQTIVPGVWRLLAVEHPGAAITIEMARSAPISFFGPVAHAARHQPDVRAAFHTFIRYRVVLSDALELSLHETPDTAAIRVFHPMDAPDGGYGAEMGVALGFRFAREVLGVPGCVRIDFAHPRIGPLAEYEAFFRAPVHFKQPHTAMVFRSVELDRPVDGHDRSVGRFLEGHLDMARSRLGVGDGGMLARVRGAILDNAQGGEYGSAALAESLGMSLRAVQRAVRAEGTTVREMVREVREAQAMCFLADRSLSIADIAFLLGYSDERAFRRAFKGWTDQSPAEARRQ